MDMMHDIALKLQANCNSKSLAEVVYAMAQLGWADSRLHSLVAEYAMDNIQVGGAGCPAGAEWWCGRAAVQLCEMINWGFAAAPALSCLHEQLHDVCQQLCYCVIC